MAIQVRTKKHNVIHILHKYQKYGQYIKIKYLTTECAFEPFKWLRK